LIDKKHFFNKKTDNPSGGANRCGVLGNAGPDIVNTAYIDVAGFLNSVVRNFRTTAGDGKASRIRWKFYRDVVFHCCQKRSSVCYLSRYVIP